MRQLYTVVVLSLLGGWQGGADKGAVKCTAEGLHLSTKTCEQAVQDMLGKVKGVSDVVVESATKTVSFKAKTGKVADEAVEALLNGGFYGKLTIGKTVVAVTSKPLDFRANEIVVRDVHACCEECDKAIQQLFKDAKVTLQGKGPQKDVTIQGNQLDADEVLRILHAAGLHGAVVEPKKK
jgi:copper chaperone CopZ